MNGSSRGQLSNFMMGCMVSLIFGGSVSILVNLPHSILNTELIIIIITGGSRNLLWGGQTKIPNRKLRAKPESRARSA